MNAEITASKSSEMNARGLCGREFGLHYLGPQQDNTGVSIPTAS